MDYQAIRDKTENGEVDAFRSHDNSTRSMSFSSQALSLSTIYGEYDPVKIPDSIDLNIILDVGSTVKVYLFGIAIKTDVEVVPNMLDISPDVKMRSVVTRVVKFTNRCKRLPISCEYVKVPFIDVNPSYKDLQMNESIEVEITIKPYKLGYENVKLHFNLLCHPDKDEKPCNVGNLSIPVTYHCIPEEVVLKPQFNMGITPLLVNEVGMFTSNVR